MVSTYIKKGLLISASALSALTLLVAAPLSVNAQTVNARMEDEVLIEEDTEMIETDVTDADVEMDAQMMDESEMEETTTTYDYDVDSDADYDEDDSESIYSSTSPRALW